MTILTCLLGFPCHALQYSPQNIPINAGPGDQSETAIAIDPNNPNHLMVTYNDANNNNYTVPGYSFSTDGGNSWSVGGQISPGVYLYGFNPSCGIDNSGNEYYMSATSNTNPPSVTPQAILISVSTNNGLSWSMYANVRPCMSLHPFIKTKHPVMDIVIIRENEEDLYAGIEHQQTDEVVQCLKLISPAAKKLFVMHLNMQSSTTAKKLPALQRIIS